MADGITQNAFLKVYKNYSEGASKATKHTVSELMHYLESVADKYGDETEVLISVEPGLTEGYMDFTMGIAGEDKVPQLILRPVIPMPVVLC